MAAATSYHTLKESQLNISVIKKNGDCHRILR